MLLLSNYIIPISGLCVAIASLCVTCYVVLKTRQFVMELLSDIKESLNQIFTPCAQDRLSLFGEILHSNAVDIGKEVSSGIQQGITGSMGGTIKKANIEAEKALAVQNPQLAQQMAFQKMLPKGLQNPVMSTLLSTIFQKALGIRGDNGHNEQATSHITNDPDSGMYG